MLEDMNKSKPKDITEYKTWLKENHGTDINNRSQIYYESVTQKILKDFNNSKLWKSIRDQLEHMDQEYYLNTKYYLFTDDRKPEIKIKPFDSFFLKTFRMNVIDNSNWPSEPEEGWILPSNWYSKISDIVRTCFVVKYLDGVKFLIDKIRLLCEENKFSFDVDFEAKEEGYYAAHAHTCYICDIPKENWDTQKVETFIELQITTQIQEVIRKLLHKYYEEHRKNIKEKGIKWQWDYKSDEFSANYLGHILHYIEGMIMDVRDKQKEEP